MENKSFTQIFHYSSGYVLLNAVSFISFPILTRVLPVNEYGLLGLITSTISIVLVIIGLGLQQSVIRYYEEFCVAKEQESFSVYYSTFFLSSMLLGVMGSFGFLIVVYTTLQNILPPDAIKVFSFVSVLICLGCLSACLKNFLRAEQKTKLFNVVLVLGKLGGLTFGVFFIFFVIKGVFGFFFGYMVANVIVVVALTRRFLRSQNIGFKHFSGTLFRKGVKYGLPLTVLQISHSLLNVGDRYIIQYYLDSVALGLYSGAYTLAMHVVELIEYPTLMAVPVLYFSLWGEKGAEAVQEFLRDGLYYFTVVAFPVMFGSISVSRELLIIMASDRFSSSAAVMPLVIVGGVIFASSTFFSAGLYIHKKTLLPGLLMLISATVNIALNVIFIPKYGIMGAAGATLVGYSSYVVMVIPVSFRYLAYRADVKAMVRCLGYSLLMFVAIWRINIDGEVATLVIRILAGALIYLGLLVTFEVKARKMLIAIVLRKSRVVDDSALCEKSAVARK